MRFHPPGSPFGAPTTGTRNVWGNWGHEGGQRMVDKDDVHQEISDIGGFSYSFRDSFDMFGISDQILLSFLESFDWPGGLSSARSSRVA